MHQLFEYAIVKQEKAAKDGTVKDAATILKTPEVILAKDVNEVNILAAREIPAEEIGNLDRVTIVVRPF